ncbi:Imm7 family immunity protein [Kribbella sp. NPDC004875]|uniref:Imm7 family immunity protein n=1 Tax=Kribbella sp. NPDC004875 TaxID=3364107 RepID=UPI0036CABF24
MYEWHGWATVVASPSPDDDDTQQHNAEEQVRRLLADAGGVANETVDCRLANGMVHVWLAGSHNRRDDTVIDLFRSIARVAPGSYGVLYAYEHGLDDGWQRWVMRRGTVELEADTDLSPHLGTVEDR